MSTLILVMMPSGSPLQFKFGGKFSLSVPIREAVLQDIVITRENGERDIVKMVPWSSIMSSPLAKLLVLSSETLLGNRVEAKSCSILTVHFVT